MFVLPLETGSFIASVCSRSRERRKQLIFRPQRAFVPLEKAYAMAKSVEKKDEP